MAQYKPQSYSQQMWPPQPIQPYPGVGYVTNNFGSQYKLFLHININIYFNAFFLMQNIILILRVTII